MTRKMALFATAFAISSQSGAATLVVSGGDLVGANGVIVAGATYNVTFVDGTCEQVYGSCSSSSFDFTTGAGAGAAAQALIDQVFLDGPDGQFDSRPDLTLGCDFLFTCQALVPFLVQSNGLVAVRYALNQRDSQPDSVLANNVDPSAPVGTEGNKNVFARFSLVSPAVPEPASWTMMITGFGAIGAAMRRRQRTSISFA